MISLFLGECKGLLGKPPGLLQDHARRLWRQAKREKRSLRGHPAPGRELAALCISAKLSLFPILQQPCYQLTVSIEGKKNMCFTTESDHKMTIQNFVIYSYQDSLRENLLHLSTALLQSSSLMPGLLSPREHSAEKYNKLLCDRVLHVSWARPPH
jgi:hypothetical protein